MIFLFLSTFLKSKRLVVGNTKEFINGSALSHEGHTHSVNDITNGVLPVSRGGTGYSDLNSLKSALGIGNALTKRVFVGSSNQILGPYTRGSYNNTYNNIAMVFPCNVTMIPLMDEITFSIQITADEYYNNSYDSSGNKRDVAIDCYLNFFFNYSTPDDVVNNCIGDEYMTHVWRVDPQGNDSGFGSNISYTNEFLRHILTNNQYQLSYVNPTIQLHTGNNEGYKNLKIVFSWNMYRTGIVV